MIYVTGDCHADFTKFSTKRFPEQREMTKDDFVIVCGDFGLWHDCEEEMYWLNWLNQKPFTTLFVDGNHENFDRLYGNEFPVVDFHGGKAHLIRSNIYHLMRSHVFELQGKKFFAFGGASSHDINDGILDEANFKTSSEFIDTCKLWSRSNKMFRINHVSWWKQELPSEEEMQFGRETLQQHNNEVDYVVTHCLPQEIISIAFGGGYDSDVLTTYFNSLLHNGLKFTSWFCGHYHYNIRVMEKFNLLYDDIVRIV